MTTDTAARARIELVAPVYFAVRRQPYSICRINWPSCFWSDHSKSYQVVIAIWQPESCKWVDLVRVAESELPGLVGNCWCAPSAHCDWTPDHETLQRGTAECIADRLREWGQADAAAALLNAGGDRGRAVVLNSIIVATPALDIESGIRLDYNNR